jgi:hypothetical protein
MEHQARGIQSNVSDTNLIRAMTVGQAMQRSRDEQHSTAYVVACIRRDGDEIERLWKKRHGEARLLQTHERDDLSPEVS